LTSSSATFYHLNAEEEPELPGHPKDLAFRKAFGPRGVLHCIADGKGGQTIQGHGSADQEGMETIDEEITSAALAWIGKTGQSRPAILPLVQLEAMHFRTHLARERPRQERAG